MRDHHHAASTPVQGPKLVLEQTEDAKDRKYSQVLVNGLDNKLHEDLEQQKKIQAHKELDHFKDFVFQVSTQRYPAAEDPLWVCPRRYKSVGIVC